MAIQRLASNKPSRPLSLAANSHAALPAAHNSWVQVPANKEFHQARNSIPAENRILTFDLNDTLTAHSYKNDANFIKKAQELGYQSYELEPGKHYILRPGAKKLLQRLTREGFEIMISTCNADNNTAKILQQTELAPYVSKVIDLNDMLKEDSKSYPQHPNNRASRWQIFKDWLYRYSVGLVKNLFLWIRSFFNSNVHSYWASPINKGHKYPPLYGSHVLFDNSSRYTDDAKWSGDWMHVKVTPFKDDLENNNENWTQEIYAVSNKLKTQSWRAL